MEALVCQVAAHVAQDRGRWVGCAGYRAEACLSGRQPGRCLAPACVGAAQAWWRRPRAVQHSCWALSRQPAFERLPTAGCAPHVRKRQPGKHVSQARWAAAMCFPRATGHDLRHTSRRQRQITHTGSRAWRCFALATAHGAQQEQALQSLSHAQPRGLWRGAVCHAAVCCQARGSKAARRLKLHQPGIEPGSHRWRRCILPLDH